MVLLLVLVLAQVAFILNQVQGENLRVWNTNVQKKLASSSRFGGGVTITETGWVGMGIADTPGRGVIVFEKRDQSTGAWSAPIERMQGNPPGLGSYGYYFGHDVAMTDTDMITGGYANHGGAYIYKRSSDDTKWVLSASLQTNMYGDHFGVSVAISDTYALVGSNYDGYNPGLKAYIFPKKSDGSWSTASQRVWQGPKGFGSDVALTDSFCIVGSNTIANIYAYDAGTDTWSAAAVIQFTAPTGAAGFGSKVSLSKSNNYAIVGAYASAEAFIYCRDTVNNDASKGYWSNTPVASLSGGSGSQFGVGVAITDNYVAIGSSATNFQTVDMFPRDPTTKTWHTKPVATMTGPAGFGGDIKANDDAMIVRASTSVGSFVFKSDPPVTCSAGYFRKPYTNSCLRNCQLAADTGGDSATFCNTGLLAGGGWTAYLIDGSDGQYKNTLRAGTNVGGYGTWYTSAATETSVKTGGAYKMSETVFDAYEFNEVIAVIQGTGANAGNWQRIRTQSGNPITSDQAFAVGGAIPSGETYLMDHGTSDGTIIKSITKSSVDTYDANHGPFFHDEWSQAYNWMWTDHSGNADARKGTIPGSKVSDMTVSWAWYGRNTNSYTAAPSAQPTKQPTAQPSKAPTPVPTLQPTAHPTPWWLSPTVAPSSFKPTAAPTAGPTAAPSAQPTKQPTAQPSKAPTPVPTLQPTAHPTPWWLSPTVAPSSFKPTAAPTAGPTAAPSAQPTASPTVKPTAVPTETPTSSPTKAAAGGTDGGGGGGSVLSALGADGEKESSNLVMILLLAVFLLSCAFLCMFLYFRRQSKLHDQKISELGVKDIYNDTEAGSAQSGFNPLHRASSAAAASAAGAAANGAVVPAGASAGDSGNVEVGVSHDDYYDDGENEEYGSLGGGGWDGDCSTTNPMVKSMAMPPAPPPPPPAAAASSSSSSSVGGEEESGSSGGKKEKRHSYSSSSSSRSSRRSSKTDKAGTATSVGRNDAILYQKTPLS